MWNRPAGVSPPTRSRAVSRATLHAHLFAVELGTGWTRALGAVGVAIVLASGCRCDRPERTQPSAQPSASASAAPESGIAIQLRLDESQQQALAELVSKRQGARFPKQAVDQRENAPLFLYLAATSADNEVLTAALHAMAVAYTSVDQHPRRVTAGPDYATVVAYHLGSANPQVMEYAIEASAHAISGKQPSRAVVDRLIELGSSHPDPAIRAEAVDRLRLVQGFWDDARIAAVLLKALHEREPYIVSRALFALRPRAAQLPDRERFLTQARVLLKHSDPGVRGRAAEFVGRLAAGNGELAKELQPLLKDEHPYVRSAAATGLSYLGYLPAAHWIVKLLGDKEKNGYELCCYRTPTGRSMRVPHDGSPWPQVRDAAVRALERLSIRTEQRFKADPVSRDDVDGSLAKNAKDARAWYQKMRAKIPRE